MNNLGRFNANFNALARGPRTEGAAGSVIDQTDPAANMPINCGRLIHPRAQVKHCIGLGRIRSCPAHEAG
jgi:hypothetical protein